MFTSRDAFADLDPVQVGERFEILGTDPRNMSALHNAGFNIITLANCHCWDAGDPGIEDTIAGLQQYNIAHCGVGMNINEESIQDKSLLIKNVIRC